MDQFFRTWKRKEGYSYCSWSKPKVYTIKPDGKDTPRLITKKRLLTEFPQYAETDFYKVMTEIQ